MTDTSITPGSGSPAPATAATPQSNQAGSPSTTGADVNTNLIINSITTKLTSSGSDIVTAINSITTALNGKPGE